jgi:hypothetical protein
MTRRLSSAVSVAALLVGVVVTTATQAAETKNRLAGNRLAGNRLAGNRLAGNRLAGNRLAGNALSSNRLEANPATAEILATADGRDVYSYLVGCALAEGVAIEATIPDAPDSAPPETNYTCDAGLCVFEGSLGLAEDWIDHKLASTEERWVSACVFARVNHHDTAEAISLRGDHPNLFVHSEEAALYTLQEGAFYGNLFTHPDDPIDWNACRGADEASADVGGLALRDCATENPATPGLTYCGFNYAGDCADFSPELPSPYACDHFDGAQGTYGDCLDDAESRRAKKKNTAKKSRTYREVITTYVSN